MTKLTLITTTFNGAEIRGVNHPEKGMIMHAVDLLRAVGYTASHGARTQLRYHGVPDAEVVTLKGSSLLFPQTGRSPAFGTATFLTRAGVHQLLMSSTKPAAKEFREWLAGEVVVAIEDTGGYLLNEAARDTAKADTREHVPLPEGIRAVYAELIAEKEARVAAEVAALRAQQTAAVEAEERRKLAVKLLEKEAENAALAEKLERMKGKAAIGERAAEHKHLLATVARTFYGLNTNAIKGDLERMKVLHKTRRGYVVRKEYRDTHFAHATHPEYGTVDIIVLPRGRAGLEKAYREGRLTMKKGFVPMLSPH